jgi:hypothetical protein
MIFHLIHPKPFESWVRDNLNKVIFIQSLLRIKMIFNEGMVQVEFDSKSSFSHFLKTNLKTSTIRSNFTFEVTVKARIIDYYID